MSAVQTSLDIRARALEAHEQARKEAERREASERDAFLEEFGTALRCAVSSILGVSSDTLPLPRVLSRAEGWKITSGSDSENPAMILTVDDGVAFTVNPDRPDALRYGTAITIACPACRVWQRPSWGVQDLAHVGHAIANAPTRCVDCEAKLATRVVQSRVAWPTELDSGDLQQHLTMVNAQNLAVIAESLDAIARNGLSQ